MTRWGQLALATLAAGALLNGIDFAVGLALSDQNEQILGDMDASREQVLAFWIFGNFVYAACMSYLSVSLRSRFGARSWIPAALVVWLVGVYSGSFAVLAGTVPVVFHLLTGGASLIGFVASALLADRLYGADALKPAAIPASTVKVA